jgi:hypothetical protein
MDAMPSPQQRCPDLQKFHAESKNVKWLLPFWPNRLNSVLKKEEWSLVGLANAFAFYASRDYHRRYRLDYFRASRDRDRVESVRKMENAEQTRPRPRGHGAGTSRKNP